MEGSFPQTIIIEELQAKEQKGIAQGDNASLYKEADKSCKIILSRGSGKEADKSCKIILSCGSGKEADKSCKIILSRRSGKEAVVLALALVLMTVSISVRIWVYCVLGKIDHHHSR